jgi:sodium/potassium-transporting ATPase subunit alpha
MTAKAIAKSVGIITCDTVEDLAERYSINESSIDPKLVNAIVVTSDKLTKMTKQELDELTHRFSEIVFARITPYQKVMIVESFQRHGNIVAVTGDGVNDSPALKQADIGKQN